MNDILELWSLPWHTLQKSLAEASGVGVAVGVSALTAAVQPADAQNPGAVSWLGRAHSRVIQAARSSHRPHV
jgi:hypothetical protein